MALSMIRDFSERTIEFVEHLVPWVELCRRCDKLMNTVLGSEGDPLPRVSERVLTCRCDSNTQWGLGCAEVAWRWVQAKTSCPF